MALQGDKLIQAGREAAASWLAASRCCLNDELKNSEVLFKSDVSYVFKHQAVVHLLILIQVLQDAAKTTLSAIT